MSARLLTALIAATIAAPTFSAEQFPSRPVRFIVPYAPGGGGDTIARVLGTRLSDKWKQNVVIDNRPGGGTVIGTDLVAKAVPDGHTVLFNTAAFAINPSLLKNLPFDAERDFIPVTQLAILPNLLVVHPSLPVNSVKELIAYAKQKSNLTYGSSGTGTAAHLAGALLTSMGGITMTHVPYKGGGALIPDIIAGRIQMTFATIPSSIAQVKAGKVRALAVASSKRSPALPDVPTIAEAALPGYDASNWISVFAPKGTPRNAVNELHSAMAALVFVPEIKEQLLGLGFEPLANTPQEFAKVMKAEFARWQRAVKASGAEAN